MDIRKTDSKGRINIGVAETHYQVKRINETDILLEAVYDVVDKIPLPAPKEALDYISSFGLDPLKIARQNANEHGYNEFVHDEAGHRSFEYGAFRYERKPWPDGFDWDEFVALATKGAK